MRFPVWRSRRCTIAGPRSNFSNMLLELAQTVAPQLTVIDAIDAMERQRSHRRHTPSAAHAVGCQRFLYPGLLPPDSWGWIPWRSSCCDRLRKRMRIRKTWNLSATGSRGAVSLPETGYHQSWISRTGAEILRKPFTFVASGC